MGIDHKTETFADTLKEARIKKGLTQRDLSEKIGVPQSHISKIESGKVDVRASSLIEIARALDLELKLVSQSLLPAIEAWGGSPEVPARTEADAHIYEAHGALEKIERDANRISRAIGKLPEITRLAETARELKGMRVTLQQAKQIRELTKSVSTLRNLFKEVSATNQNVTDLLKRPDVARVLQEVAQTANAFRSIRNALAHGLTSSSVGTIPAYRLNDGDDDA
jgi:transcriptional regulator with XRE-family HTH domain